MKKMLAFVQRRGKTPAAMQNQAENQLAATIEEWSGIHKTMTKLRVREMLLRKRIVAACFPTRHEGAQESETAGYLVKAVVKLARRIDAPALPAVAAQLPEGSGDRLVDWKPSLRVREYKALSAEHRAIFDQALVIREGSPTLTVERIAN